MDDNPPLSENAHGLAVSEVNGVEVICALFAQYADSAYKSGYSEGLSDCQRLLEGYFEGLPQDAQHLAALTNITLRFAELRDKQRTKTK